jgi:hypothetical protein
LTNYHSAEVGAQDALIAFESLRAPRGQAACRRLLAMIGIDTDDSAMAQFHAAHATQLYQAMEDPWGIMEANLLGCQIALMVHDTDNARTLLDECANITVEEPEPRQHYLLSRAWIEAELGDLERSAKSIEAASSVFATKTRIGDHTFHLLGRLARYAWPPEARRAMEAWREQLQDRGRRVLKPS